MIEHTKEAIGLLHQLIAVPSFSREEEETAEVIESFFRERHIPTHRKGNNIWAYSQHRDEGKPYVLLNSHHDTVRPAQGWQRDPFTPAIEGEALYGLGSNDAGGPLVSLIATFLHFYKREGLPFNLVMAATAEEEISGPNGIASILEELPEIAVGIIGEPTQMQLAIAERGLMVIDAVARGKSGHAARDEGVNAIYLALQDIQWIKDYRFEKISPTLGPVKATVTQIEAGSQHNVVPDACRYVIDVRTQECYTNREVFDILQEHTLAELTARSFRLNPSGISSDHPLVQAGIALGMKTYGSPTLSDQALCAFPTVKIGPGDSARSHTADEFIRLSEVETGIKMYIQLMSAFARRGTDEMVIGY
ncbi:MAG: M20 family metallo-hydrolase [Phaeodactylibacter sp.]|nr:M20 family metallo-hydrolase [Phaeodactylibacter sp.]MCB9048114.1 M20 family metallo-hydrolase [Lewinellaceae bacterium]